MFTVKGMVYGRPLSITYTVENGTGRLSGDPVMTALVEDAMNSPELTGPVGQYLERDINDPLATLFVIKECFHSITGYDGQLPEADAMPDGAI